MQTPVIGRQAANEFTGIEADKTREDRASRYWSQTRDGWGPGGWSVAESVAQDLKSFALNRMALYRVCDRSLF
jgi:hypothetical protein